jgi:hypothetical protein
MKTIQELFDEIADKLNAAHAPAVIEKGGRFCMGGNTQSLMPVCADRHGRLWREENDRLVLLGQASQ